MELKEAIKNRRSIRRFKDTPIAKEKIEKLINLAMWAPSGMNRQNWHFIIVKGEIKNKLIDMRTVEGELTDIQSVASAIQNLLLLLYEEGLGGCWMTGPVHLDGEINKILCVEDKRLQAIIPVGVPDMTPPTPKRKEGRIEWIGWD